jgi:hypothetical protein
LGNELPGGRSCAAMLPPNALLPPGWIAGAVKWRRIHAGLGKREQGYKAGLWKECIHAEIASAASARTG